MADSGDALALLQQTYFILNNDDDVSGLDIISRYIDPNTKVETDTLSLNSAQQALVINAVSIPMEGFGKKIDMADRYLNQQRSTACLMLIIVMLIMAGVLTAALASIVMTVLTKFSSLSDAFQDPSFVKMFIMVIVLTVVVLVILWMWTLMLQDQLQRNNHIYNAMYPARNLASLVSNQFAIQFAAATQLGRVQEFVLNRLTKGVDDPTIAECTREAPTQIAPKDPCVIDVCKARKADLVGIMELTCDNDKTALLTALGKLKTDGVSSYDRRALWDQIADGIDALRGEVLTELDADAPATNVGALALTKTRVQQIVTSELVPVLKIPAVEVYDLVVSATLYPSGIIGRTGQRTLTTKLDTWTACLADPACRWASWDPVGSIGILDPADVATPVFVYSPVSPSSGTATTRLPQLLVKGNLLASSSDVLKGPYADKVFVCVAVGGAMSSTVMDASTKISAPVSSNAKTAVSEMAALTTMCTGQASCDLFAPSTQTSWTMSGQPSSYLNVFATAPLGPLPAEAVPTANSADTKIGMCLRTDFASIFRDAATNTAMSTTFRDLQPHMVNGIVALLTLYAGQVKPVSYRAQIDGLLTDYYGDVLYSKSLSTQVDIVISSSMTKSLVNASRANAKYITPQRLLDKFNGTPTSTWAVLTTACTTMSTSAILFNNTFPAYSSNLGIKIAGLLSFTFMFLGTVGLIVFLVMSWKQKKKLTPQAIVDGARSTLARSAIIAGCMFALVVVVMGTYIMKARAKKSHNDSAIQSNGQDLLVAMSTLVKSDAALVNVPNASNAKAYMLAAQRTLEKYAMCNVITWGAINVSPPIPELVAYLCVSAVAIATAMYMIGQLDPRGCVSNIRQLYTLREMIMTGRMVNPSVLVKVVQQACPPTIAWNALTWLAVLVFALLNVFVMSNISGSSEDFEFALDAIPDCV